MEDIYETTTTREGRAMIIIRRKPSQIPYGIDSQLMHIGTMGHMNGPDNWCGYEFFFKDGLAKGEKLLQSCGWKKKEG